MKALRIILIGAVVLLIAAALAAPIGPVPGFLIGGTATAAPGQWPDTSTTHEILLKVPGTPPRVVTVWVIQHQGELHVVGAPNSGWVSRLGSGGPVQVRLGSNRYDLVASRMTTGWQPVLEAYVAKYRPDYPEIVDEFPPLEQADGQFALFRLERPQS